MSFGLGRGQPLDPGAVGLTLADLPPLPDAIGTDPLAGRLDPRAWFPHPERPLELEIGSGKGTFLLAEAARLPETNFLGIEWEHEFFAYAADRIRRAGLTNVRMLHADATEFLRWRCPDAILRVIHLYFSDPWPKSRHHRRRVVQDRFLADAARVLAPGGELRIVTDHDDYWAWMEDHFARWTAPDAEPVVGPAGGGNTDSGGSAPFTREAFDPPASAREGELVGTNFERKYRREGRPFHAATLRRR
ncbi:MAG: tRNA (guanosine(46)-N7)-methyltransferase TrmB [Phycisphaerae bacterium]|nr:tRNA (guanosine(46)-N7)-methyltransferase TrmB [Phycisphaerae bacterium]